MKLENLFSPGIHGGNPLGSLAGIPQAIPDGNSLAIPREFPRIKITAKYHLEMLVKS